MFKKLLLVATLFVGLTLSSHAQNFTLFAHPADSLTEGSPNDIQMYNRVTNVSTDSIVLKWRTISESYPDTNWHCTGLCDNVVCYYDTNVVHGYLARKTDVMKPDTFFDFIAHFTVPVSAANGTGTIKVGISDTVTGQTDTLVFNLIKSPTSISGVTMYDTRVSVYPNPSKLTNITVATDKSLNASNILVFNIMGQTVLNATVSKESQNTSLNINSLSKGSYLIKIIDNKGQIVTTRKFIKE